MAIFRKRTIQIERDTGIDLSGATLLQIRYIKPDKISKGFWTAAQVDDTSIIRYKTTPTDIDQHGEWKVQAYVEVGADKYSGDFTIVNVEKPIDL